VIHAITPYGREGASSRVRVHEWLDRISERRVVSSYVSHQNAAALHLALHPSAVLHAERNLRRIAAARPRLLLLHREASPFSRGSLEWRLLMSAEWSVYDFDDALQWDEGGGKFYRRFAPKATKARIAVRTADRVIAGNPILAEWASRYNHDVTVVPSCVSLDSYQRKVDYQLRDPPRLGWIGSPNNEVYLLLIGDALRELHRQTNARLTVIGTTRPRLGELEKIIDRIPWSETNQRDCLRDVDIGLFPVPDVRYSYGKSGYKLVQYGAVGLPAVASPVGVNEQILAEFGMPAATDTGSWVEAVLELLHSTDDFRAGLGQAAREVVRQGYSFEAWLPTWRRLTGLDAAVSGDHRAARCLPR
jgi:glycosyltransferase involved in cell wall biosynthesis